jgi:hypothetical protein
MSAEVNIKVKYPNGETDKFGYICYLNFLADEIKANVIRRFVKENAVIEMNINIKKVGKE